MSNERGVVEGIQPQGVDESIVYTITTTNIGSDPSGVTVVVYDVKANYDDVTEAVMPAGSAVVQGDVIVLPPLTGLALKRSYQVEVKCTIEGNIVEIPFTVYCTR
jgi:hypothetical protein